jgi:hypothetical protein
MSNNMGHRSATAVGHLDIAADVQSGSTSTTPDLDRHAHRDPRATLNHPTLRLPDPPTG